MQPPVTSRNKVPVSTNQSQRRSRAPVILASLLWVGSWLMVIPVPRSLKWFPAQAGNWWGLFYMMTPPYKKFGTPVDSWIANNSLYIGYATMLVTSFVVVQAAGRSRRAKYLVVLADLAIIVVTLLIARP